MKSNKIASSPTLSSFHRSCSSGALLSSEIAHAAREIGFARHLRENAIQYARHLERAGLTESPRHLYSLANIVRQAERATHAAHCKIAEVKEDYVIPDYEIDAEESS